MKRDVNKKETKKTINLQIHFLVIKRFIFIAGALALITLALGFYFFVIPQMKEKSVKEARIKELRGEVDSLSKIVTELSKQKVEDSVLSLQRLDTIEKIMPLESTKEYLYLVIAEMVQDKGLTLENLIISGPGSFSDFVASGGGRYFKQNYAKIQLPISVVSISMEVKDSSGAQIGYEEIKSIFDHLLRSKRIFNISSLKIDQIRGTEASGGRLPDEGKMSVYKVTFDTFLLRDTQDKKVTQ